MASRQTYEGCLAILCASRYAEEAPEDEAEVPKLVPLTPPSSAEAATALQGKKAVGASEGTPLLADRAWAKELQPVGGAASGINTDKTEKSTLDGEDFVDLGNNAIIAELEPERCSSLRSLCCG